MLGAADRSMYVGGADREFADPRLNEGWLRRVARASGGRYVRGADASRVPSFLQETNKLPVRSRASPLGFVSEVTNGFTLKFDVILYSETGTRCPRGPLKVT